MLSQNSEATHEPTAYNKKVFINLILSNTKDKIKTKFEISCLIENLIIVLLVHYNNTTLDLTLVLKYHREKTYCYGCRSGRKFK